MSEEGPGGVQAGRPPLFCPLPNAGWGWQGRPDLWGDVRAEAAGALTPRGHGDEVQALLLARSPRRWHGSVEQPRLPEKHLARGQNDLRVQVGPLQVKASGPPGRARASPITLPLSPGLPSSPKTGWRGPACRLCWGPGWEALQVSMPAAPSRSVPPASLSHRLHPTRVQASLRLLHPGADPEMTHPCPATGYARIEAPGTWKVNMLPWSGTRDGTGWAGLGSGLTGSSRRDQAGAGWGPGRALQMGLTPPGGRKEVPREHGLPPL